jgi:hypothetical protein
MGMRFTYGFPVISISLALVCGLIAEVVEGKRMHAVKV